MILDLNFKTFKAIFYEQTCKLTWDLDLKELITSLEVFCLFTICIFNTGLKFQKIKCDQKFKIFRFRIIMKMIKV